MFVHNLSGGGPDSVRVLPDLQCDVDQRNDHGNGADDLSEVSEVIEIHVSETLAGRRKTGR
jgi:hypothetical protein